MSRPEQDGASYRAVLALPHARSLFAASLLARLCYGLVGLPLLIALREGTGCYAVAGTAVSLYALGAALLGPARARLVQRHRSALILLAGGYTLSVAVLAAACAVRVPGLLAIGLAVLTGLCPPPVGPLMRALWSRLAAGEAQQQRALSLDTAAESTAFALGPVLGGMLIAASSAPVVLAGCAALGLTGFSSLAAALRRVRFSARADPASPAGPAAPLRAQGFPPLLLLAWAIAAAVAACEIATVAAWGVLTAGVLTSLFPVGGVLGGLVYGRRQCRSPLNRRPLGLAATSAVCYTVPALAYVPAAAGMALLLAGACADILLITTYQMVNVLVSDSARAEAGAWLNTAYNLGAAMGTAAAGILVDQSGPRMSFAVIAGLTGCCTVISASHALRRRAVQTVLRSPAGQSPDT